MEKSTCCGWLRISCTKANLLLCRSLSGMPCSQEHFPVELSTYSHMDSRPIISTRVTGVSLSGSLALMLRTVSTTILCCDCLPVMNRTCCPVFCLDTDNAAEREAAVFPIPVGALANRYPPFETTSKPSLIILTWLSRRVSCARNRASVTELSVVMEPSLWLGPP